MPRKPILMGQAERVATEPPCPTPLTRTVLDRHSKASETGFVTIYPKCHPDSGMRVAYDPTDGCALLICVLCGAGVGWLQLAAEVPS